MPGREPYVTIVPQRRAWLLALADVMARSLALESTDQGLDVLALVYGWSARPESPFRADLLVEFDAVARYCRELAAELRGLPAEVAP